MADVRIPAVSTEYIRVPVQATKGGVSYNPTADVVKFAFLASAVAQPVTNDWHLAGWDTGGPPYYAQCLVGPAGNVNLTVGTYYVWVQVTDSPEVPVRQAGTVTIY